MFSRRNFLQLASSIGAGYRLPAVDESVKSAIVEGISSIAKASKVLSVDSIYALNLDFGTIADSLADSKLSIYACSALRSAAQSLKSTPCISIPFIDLYTYPHSDTVLGDSSNRSPNWPSEKVAIIDTPPQFMMDLKLSGHRDYAAKILNKYGIISTPATVERFIGLQNQYRSSLEQALHKPEIANWLSSCSYIDVLSELHRMLGVHRQISSLVKHVSSLLPEAKGSKQMRDFVNELTQGRYSNIIDHPVVMACDRLAEFASSGMRERFLLRDNMEGGSSNYQKNPKAWMQQHKEQIAELEGVERDIDFLSQNGIALDANDSTKKVIEDCNAKILEVSDTIKRNENQIYTPNGSVRTIKNSIVISEVNAKPLNFKFNRTKSGYWIDKNGVYLILPRINREKEKAASSTV